MLPIFIKPNTVLFKGLPPIPKGTTLFADGVPDYLLTVDQALDEFYTKIQSDARFLRLTGGTMTGNISFKKSPAGILGNYWFDPDNNLLASIEGDVNGLLLGYYNKDDITKNYYLCIANEFFGLTKDLGVPAIDSLKLLQAKYGVRKNAPINSEIDNIFFQNGWYTLNAPGKLRFFSERDGEIGQIDFTGHSLFINLIGSSSNGYVLADTPEVGSDYLLVNKLYLKNNTIPTLLTEDVEVDLNTKAIKVKNGIWRFGYVSGGIDHYLNIDCRAEQGILDATDFSTKLGVVEGGTWNDLPTGPILSGLNSLDDLSFVQAGYLKNFKSDYDAIVKSGTVNSGKYEYNTVKDALDSGKKKIKILAGEYNTDGLFWPDGSSILVDDIEITGEDNTTIYGTNLNSGALDLDNWYFKNLIFKVHPAGSKAFCSAVKFSKFKFENCQFVINSAVGSGQIGFDYANMNYGVYDLTLDYALEFKNCLFLGDIIKGAYALCSRQLYDDVNDLIPYDANRFALGKGILIDSCYFYNWENCINVISASHFDIRNNFFNYYSIGISAGDYPATYLGFQTPHTGVSIPSAFRAKVNIFNNTFESYSDDVYCICIETAVANNVGKGRFNILNNLFKASPNIGSSSTGLSKSIYFNCSNGSNDLHTTQIFNNIFEGYQNDTRLNTGLEWVMTYYTKASNYIVGQADGSTALNDLTASTNTGLKLVCGHNSIIKTE
jgi:hypothetical protein